MALLDRFRPQARHKHPDAAIRLAYIDEIPIDERDLIAEIARDDNDARVRRAAVAKLLDPAALAAVARADVDDGVRAQAVVMLRDIALESFEGLGEAESAAAVGALEDAKALAHVAKYATREAIALGALARVTDVHTDGSIARHAELEAVRRAAFVRLSDHAEMLGVALNSEFKDTALAAVERLSDRAELEQVAARAKNRSAAKRARGILREQDERAAAEAAAAPPPPPDPAVAARAERLHLAQKLEARRPPPTSLPRGRRWPRREAAWAALDGEADGSVAARFAAAVDPLLARIADADAQAERARADEDAARLRAEPGAVARAAAAAAAAEDARQRRGEGRRAPRLRLVELAADAEGAAGDEDLASARRRMSLVRREWKDCSAGLDVDAELLARFTAADGRVAAREADAEEKDARARREALHRLNQLLGRVEPLLAGAEMSLKAAERALRDVRAALGDVPPLPSKRDFDEVVRRLKAAQSALTPKVTELREAEEWQRFANVAVQEQLCARMEALKAIEDPEAIAREIHELQEQWRKSADVPRAQADALWRRFKAAHDEIWPRCEAYFAAQAEQRAANLAAKVALCGARRSALPTRPTGSRSPTRSRSCRPSGRRSGRSRAARKRPCGSASAPPAIASSRGVKPTSSRARRSGARTSPRRKRCRVRAEALAESTDWDAAAAEIKTAAGRVEDDRAGEEEPVRSDLAALSRRLRSLLHPLRAAPRRRARRARRGARGDLRRAGSARAARRRRGGRARRAGRRSPGDRPRGARTLAARARGARRRSRARAGARPALRRRVRSAPRRLARRVRTARTSTPTPTASAWKRSCAASRISPDRSAAPRPRPTTRCRRRPGSPRC